jgi:Coenzyme PQQ synthesis protein D (PqqD)
MIESYVARGSKLAARLLGNQTLVMSAPDSTIFTLNEIGSVIWAAADGRSSLRQIVQDKICTEFEIEPEQALADCGEFVSQLAEHGIFILSESPLAEEEPQ